MFVVVILFRSSSNVHVRRCDFFGQVHIFQTYSFGHIDLVKRLFLNVGVRYIIFFKFKFYINNTTLQMFTNLVETFEFLILAGTFFKFGGNIYSLYCHYILLAYCRKPSDKPC